MAHMATGEGSPLFDLSTLTRISEGSIWAEGPVWVPDTRTLRWSDIPANRIREWALDTGEVRDYATDVEFTNGRTLDIDGSVVQCSHGRRRVERDHQGQLESVVESFDGVRLNSPNDVVVSPSGDLWFTDPAYGIIEAREGHPGVREYGDHFVFRWDRHSRRLHAVITDVEEPNGLAFSPDGSVLYVADSSAVRKAPGVGNRSIRAYDVQGGTRAKNGRRFTELAEEDGFPDGIRVDHEGRVWSSSARGVIVFDPSGAEVARLPMPDVVGNLCFGGESGSTLFICCTTEIYRIETSVTDAWVGRPRARRAAG